MGKYADLVETKGEYTQLLLTTRMRDAEGKENTKEQVVTKMVTDGSERHCYQQLQAMKEDMKKNKREVIAIYPPGNDGNGAIIRKMAECVFANTEIHCKVYYTTKGDTKTSGRKGADNTEAILVSKGEGKSYAELLKTVKDGMKGRDEMTKNITSIRQTRSGDMLITTKKEKANAEAIKKVLNEVADVSTRLGKKGRGRDDVTIFVKGMDAITTKAEVREALI